MKNILIAINSICVAIICYMTFVAKNNTQYLELTSLLAVIVIVVNILLATKYLRKDK